MNKVLNINLGGIAFTIDEDAYVYLEKYLQSLRNHFQQSEGADEIVHDIEARLAELISEGRGQRSIVSLRDVENAVSVMGTPEDFGAEPIKHTEGGSASGIKTGRRLFRDPDDRFLGGVCSGLAAYFGVKDPLWVRMGFLFFFLVFGSGFFLYLILLVLVPEAQTAADRLAMRGEPVDINSIAKDFEEKINDFSKPENQARFQNRISSASSQIFDALATLFKGLGKVWIVIFGVILLMALGSSLIGIISGSVALTLAFPFFDYLFEVSWYPMLGLINVIFIALVPILTMIWTLRRLFFKRATNNYVQMGAWAFWTLNIVSLSFLVMTTVRNFSNEAISNVPIVENANTPPVLTIAIPKRQPYSFTWFDNINISDEQLLCRHVNVRVEATSDTKITLEKYPESRGATQREAQSLADQIEHQSYFSNDSLIIDPTVRIPKGTKWRGQNIEMVLKVPYGTRIRFDDITGSDHLDFKQSGTRKQRRSCYDSFIKTWEATSTGFVCVMPIKTESSDEDDDR